MYLLPIIITLSCEYVVQCACPSRWDLGGPARQSADIRPRLAENISWDWFYSREREVSWGLSASASDTGSNNTPEAAEEKREDRCGGLGENTGQSGSLSVIVRLPPLLPLQSSQPQTRQWLTTCSGLVKWSELSPLKVTRAVKVNILTPHWQGTVSLVCSEEIDLSCICYILFSPRPSAVLQWNTVQFTFCFC